jgi:hypothetical protein
MRILGENHKALYEGGILMVNMTSSDIAIVSCGILNLELNYLKSEMASTELKNEACGLWGYRP